MSRDVMTNVILRFLRQRMQGDSEAGRDRYASNRSRVADGPGKIGKQAVCSRSHTRMVVGDGKTKDIKSNPYRGAGAFQIGEWIASQKKLRAHSAFHARAAAFGPAHKFVAHPCCTAAADLLRAEVAQTGPLYLV